MKIKDLKQPYKALALVRQKEQGNEPNEDADIKDQYSAFLWANTKEGHSFWHTVWINNYAPIGAKESSFWWLDVERGLYPPIPPDSLKDIPLQTRWDSGERFRTKAITGAKLKNIHVFESGQVAYVYDYNEAYCCPSEEYFFQHFEPIPSEPQTRRVNVYVSESGSATTIVNDVNHTNATMSFQQPLIHPKGGKA